MSKGSGRRPSNVPRESFNARWDAIFGTKRRAKATPVSHKVDSETGDSLTFSPKTPKQERDDV